MCVGVCVRRTGPGGGVGQELLRPAAVLHRERVHAGRRAPDRDVR